MNRHRALAKHALAVRDGVRAALTPMFGGRLHDSWYLNIAETDDQAVLMRDMEGVGQ